VTGVFLRLRRRPVRANVGSEGRDAFGVRSRPQTRVVGASLELIQFSRSAASNHEDNELYLRNVYAGVVALSHGLPLPPAE